MRTKWVALALVAAVAPSVGQARADDGKRFGQEILDILRTDGTIDDERYHEFETTEAAEALPAVSSEPVDWEIRFKRGLEFSRKDGKAKFEIGGRIQADFATIHVDDALDTAVPGGEWFVRQAAQQYRLFTSQEPDDELLRAAFSHALDEDRGS